MNIILGIFFILHGMVHLLYAGQSQRLFELQPGMAWPDGSWIFSKVFSDETTRLLATILLILAALCFVIGGLGLFIRQDWWRAIITIAAVFSSLVYIVYWDAGFQALSEKGGIGVLINLAILVMVLVLKWPV